MPEKCTQIIHWLQDDNQRKAFSRVWSISWPMTMIMLFEFLISLADVYIAGKVGKEIQASYGFVTQLYFVFTVIGNAFTVGTVSVISRLCPSIGSKEYAGAVFSSIMTTVGTGVVLGVAGIILSPVILRFLNIPPELKQFGIPLITIYAGGIIFHYLLINTNGLLRACKGVMSSLKTMAFVCLVNIGLNFLFVFYTPLGFRGIALSTAVSVLLGAIINLVHLKAIFWHNRCFYWRIVRKVFQIGWPSGLLQVIWQLGSTIIFLILSALPANNVEIIAAFTNGYRLESVIFLPAFAFNMANAVVVGNLLGEDNKEDAFRNGIFTAVLGVLLVGVTTLIILVNAAYLVAFLSTNQIVIHYSIKYLLICLPFEPFMAWGVILGGGLNGAGDTRSVMVVVALSIWFVRIPFSYLLGVVLQLGAPGVWWAMNASIVIQAILITVWYFKRRWLENA